MYTKFKDSEGNVIATLECDSEEFLVAVEKRLIGTRLICETGEGRRGRLDVWIASAAVYDYDGAFVMEYEPVTEEEPSSE